MRWGIRRRCWQRSCASGFIEQGPGSRAWYSRRAVWNARVRGEKPPEIARFGQIRQSGVILMKLGLYMGAGVVDRLLDDVDTWIHAAYSSRLSLRAMFARGDIDRGIGRVESELRGLDVNGEGSVAFDFAAHGDEANFIKVVFFEAFFGADDFDQVLASGG